MKPAIVIKGDDEQGNRQTVIIEYPVLFETYYESLQGLTNLSIQTYESYDEAWVFRAEGSVSGHRSKD